MMKFVRYFPIVSLLVVAPATVLASGFSLLDYSARELGTGLAGTASSIDDATAVYANPAGLPSIGARQISGGFSYVAPKTDIHNATGTFPGSNDGDMVDATPIPFLYAAAPVDKNWSVGLGLFVPFGLSTDYEKGFQGRYFGQRSSIRVITLQPVVGWQITKSLALGFGPNWNSIEGELSKAIPNGASPGSNDLQATVKGDATAWGYTAGFLYKPFSDTAVGITYHSRVDVELNGDTKLSIPGVGTNKYKANVDVTLPDIWDVSISQQLPSAWTLHASVKRTGWGVFDELRVKGPVASVEPQDWHDTYLYAVGLSHALNSKWLLRLGVAQDQSPIPNATRGVRLPSDDRTIYGMGARWTYDTNISVDLAYAYVVQRPTSVNLSSGQLHYSADYDTSLSNLRAQINWSF